MVVYGMVETLQPRLVGERVLASRVGSDDEEPKEIEASLGNIAARVNHSTFPFHPATLNFRDHAIQAARQRSQRSTKASL